MNNKYGYPDLKFNIETVTGRTLNEIYLTLCAGNEVTTYEAHKYHTTGACVPRRIKDLKDKYQVPVHTEDRKVGKRSVISVYTLPKLQPVQTNLFNNAA